MRDPNDQHDQLAVLHLVEDSVVADPDAPQPGEVALQDGAAQWVGGKAVDRLDESLSLGAGNGGQVPRRVRLLMAYTLVS